MKNDLTAEEWIALNNYLQFGVSAYTHDETGKGLELFKSAKEKIKQTAKEIRKNRR